MNKEKYYPLRFQESQVKKIKAFAKSKGISFQEVVRVGIDLFNEKFNANFEESTRSRLTKEQVLEILNKK